MEAVRQVEVELGPGCHGGHHHLEPQQAGHADLLEGAAVFLGQRLRRLIGAVRMRRIANASQALQQFAERHLAVGPAHLQPVVGKIQARLGHRRQAAQVFLDQPAAGGTADAFDQQGGFRQFAFMLHEGLLHLGAVVERQFIGEHLRQRLGVGRGFAAVAVVAFQAATDDGFGHRLATRTTEFAGFAQYRRDKAAAGGNRQAAVEAGKGTAHRGGISFPA